MLNPLLVERPIFTEKTERLKNKESAYVFKVSQKANKIEIRKIIESLYKVKVKSVKVINVRPKFISREGITGVKSGYKKAIVKLQSGHKIENI